MANDLQVSIGANISDLEKKIAQAQKAVQDAFKNVNTEGLQNTIKNLSQGLNVLGGNAELFGKSINHSKQELSLYQKALNDLLAQGIRPTAPAVLDLAENIDRLTKEISESEQKTTSFSDKLKGISSVGDKLQSIGSKLSVGLTLPITALGTASIKAYGDIQALEKGLEAVMGSSSRATAELSKLQVVAQLPGLGMQEAVKGSINLQAIGISADKSRSILSQFGNAVASVGKGRVEFERAIYGVQQLANTDFPLGEDLNIIKDALPQVSNLLKQAFGSSRSDELAKMGISSKQVLDTIVTGLEKLPRVSGGINGAFENLGDSLKVTLSKIGGVIDKNFNISKIVDKLSGWLGKIGTNFENLSKPIQGTILVVTGLVAAIGPLLVTIGTLLKTLPLMASALNLTTASFSAMLGPIGLVVGALALLTVGYLALRNNQKTALELQKEWKTSLASANVEAKNQVDKLKELYKTATDTTKSQKDRNDAVKEMQSLYPNYLGNIDKEVIKNGNAKTQYDELAKAIYRSATAKAASAEIDKRETERLQERLKIEEKIRSAQEDIKNPKSVRMNGGGGAGGANLGTYYDAEHVKKQAEYSLKFWIDYLKKKNEEWRKSDADLLKYVKQGQDDINKLSTEGGQGGGIGGMLFPKGSQGWIKQQIDKLQKSLDYLVPKSDKWNAVNAQIKKYNDLLAISNDKIFQKGSEGWYQAEISRLEELKKSVVSGSAAWVTYANEIQRLKDILNGVDVKPLFNPNAMQDNATYFNKMAESIKVGTQKLMTVIDASAIELGVIQANFNERLNQLITESSINSITDLFGAMGDAIGNGGNVLAAAGASIVNSIGVFAQMLGKEIVKLGVESMALGKLIIGIKNAIKSPWALVALGAAAIAVGALLSSASKSIGSVSNGGSGGSYTNDVGNNGTYSVTGASYSSESQRDFRFVINGYDLVSVIDKNRERSTRLNAN